MNSCVSDCMEFSIGKVSTNILDRILGRSLTEKIEDNCYCSCLKILNLQKYKRSMNWIYTPVFGISEIASSFIALINLLTNIICYRKYLTTTIDNSPLAIDYKIQYIMSNIAYFSSFYYHARINAFSRNADYISAFGAVLSAVIFSCNRIVLTFKKEKLK